MIALDPELGPVRYCRGCDDWYPDDAEFFYREPKRPTAVHCRACKAEATARHDAKRRAA